MDYTSFRSLCPPSAFFFIISLVTVIILASYQSFTGIDIYCIGREECNLPGRPTIFIIKLLFIFFWTWILNLICQHGTTTIAWFLVLIPYLIFVIMIVSYYLGGFITSSTTLQNIFHT